MIKAQVALVNRFKKIPLTPLISLSTIILPSEIVLEVSKIKIDNKIFYMTNSQDKLKSENLNNFF